MWVARYSPCRSDYYNIVTTLLSAHDVRVRVARINAASIGGTGATLLALIVSPVAPRWAGGWLIALAIALCSFVMAALWLRHRWPSRTESTLGVLVATICIALACIIPTDPLVGMLGATVFVLAVSYTAVFHNQLLLAYTLTIASITVAVLAVRLAARSYVIALGSATIVIILVAFAAITCRLLVGLTGSAEHPGTVEPLTGLLSRESFYELTSTMLASRSRGDDTFLVIAVVDIDSFAALVSIVGARSGERRREEVGRALRETVRRDAVVGHMTDTEFLVADTFTTADPSPLIERIRGMIAASQSGLTASIGVLSTLLRPLADRPPHDVLDRAVALAAEAMREARSAGGNQVRYVMAPHLDGNGEGIGNDKGGPFQFPP